MIATPPWLDRATYPFTPRTLELASGRLHYVDEGPPGGEVVLFVHGTPTWSYEYRHLVYALRATHRCVAPDHLGFGLSDRPPRAGYGPAEHASRLASFVDRLGLEGVTLVVHDFGGPIGLPLALDRPSRVRRLLLLNTWMWSFDDDPLVRRRAGQVGGRLGRLLYRYANLSLRVLTPYAYGDRAKLTRAVHRHYLAPFRDRGTRERVLWALARGLLGASPYYTDLWRRRAELLGRPTAIVWGMADPAFTPRHLARWRELFGDAARVVELPGVGHWPHEEAPETVLAVLRGLLATD